MAPKKDPKKPDPQPPKQQQQPVIPPHELQGYGRFQYLDGAVYEGNWHLFDGVKMKHGQGILKIPGISNGSIGAQQYEGQWEKDEMSGYGTYLYANGAIYRGSWKNNKHHGRGQYQFPDGTNYEGDWENHLMHGAGIFIDSNGRKWQGQFRNGKYESKLQKQLAKEREVIVKKASIITQIGEVMGRMLEALAKSDKKTLKQNFAPFFASGEVIKEQLKEPFAKFDERPQQKWTEILTALKSGKINPLSKAQQSDFIGSQRILKKQLEGPGQIVQMSCSKEDKKLKGGFINVEGTTWVLVGIAE